MRVRNISKEVQSYMKIHRKHIGKTIVDHNRNTLVTSCHVSTASLLRSLQRRGDYTSSRESVAKACTW